MQKIILSLAAFFLSLPLFISKASADLLVEGNPVDDVLLNFDTISRVITVLAVVGLIGVVVLVVVLVLLRNKKKK